jgi:glycosyltransferase 2 family protein
VSARSRRIQALAGNLFALAGLVWVFHDLHFQAFKAAVTGLNWAWVPLAVAFDVGNYVIQAGRWCLLLLPLGRIPLPAMTGVIYAGLFINEILPLRAGELLRTYLVARRLSTEMKRIIPSIVVERLLDGFWLAIAIALVALRVKLPGSLLHAGEVLGGIVLLGLLLFVFLMLRQKGSETPDTGPRSPLATALAHQADGLRSIGLTPGFWGALGLTSCMLLFQGAAFWLVARACHLPISLPTGIAVFLIVHLGTALPNAPGNVGAYQFFCVLALSLFGVEKTQAAAFSVVVFVLLSLPFWVLGALALRAQGLTVAGAKAHLTGD